MRPAYLKSFSTFRVQPFGRRGREEHFGVRLGPEELGNLAIVSPKKFLGEAAVEVNDATLEGVGRAELSDFDWMGTLRYATIFRFGRRRVWRNGF